MNCEQIHETAIGEIEEIIKGAKELRKDKKILGNKSWSSIAKATSNLTLTFPVLISRNVPIETAQIVTKACERDDVSMLQVLFSAMSITQAEDGIEYIKRIHTNLNLGNKIDLDAFINAMDSTPTQEAVSYIDAYDAIKEDMKNINYTLDDSISDRGLNEYQLLKENNNYILLEGPAPQIPPLDNFLKERVPDYYNDLYYNDFLMINPDFLATLGSNDDFTVDVMQYLSQQWNVPPAYVADAVRSAQNQAKITGDATKLDGLHKDIFRFYTLYRMQQDGITPDKIANMYMRNNELMQNEYQRKKDNKRQKKIDKRRYELDKDKLDLDTRKFGLDLDKFGYQQQLDRVNIIQKQHSDLFNRNSRMLIDSDVKKANEMIPTLMNVQFTKVVDSYPVVSSMIVGVKAKMIPLDSADIMNRIVNKNKDNNFFIKFFRATTREISFIKDFVLAIDKSRSDALSFSKKGKSNKIWKILERRSKKSAMSKIFNTNNCAMAISTLIITVEEVEALKKINNIDLNDTKIAAGIMQSYNLMAFGIVDDTLQTFKVMKDDGDYTYSTYAYSALEKELQDNAKKTINLMTKLAK